MGQGQSIKYLSEYFGYTRDAYYKSLSNQSSSKMEAEMILSSAMEIRRKHPRMGGKKMYYLLKDLAKEFHIGRDKFFDILRAAGLLVKQKSRGIRTTNSYHRFHVYKNELSKTKIISPNQAWCSDITYIRTEAGFVYLFLITDVYSRKIVGWDVSSNLSLEGGIKALKQALNQCKSPQGVIHHSDRGIQYCSNEYTQILHTNKMRISMTEENHCYENAIAERVNGILKDEYMLASSFKDLSMVRKACSEVIALYNEKRPHWSLGLKMPEEVHNGVYGEFLEGDEAVQKVFCHPFNYCMQGLKLISISK
jgi:transposase InsO family protein